MSSQGPNDPNIAANPLALPASLLQGVVDTNQSAPPPLNSIYAAKAFKQTDAANGLNSTRADDSAVGQLQAALEQVATNAPRAFPGMALPEVCSEVQCLQQSYGSLLQRMTTLEANLHGVKQQQGLPSDSRVLNPFESQHAQRVCAASPIGAPNFVATKDQKELKATAEHLPTQTPNASQQQHSVHSMRPPAMRARAKGQANRKHEQQATACLRFRTSRVEAAWDRETCSKTSEAKQGAEDRQEHRPQVSLERILCTCSAFVNELFVCSLTHVCLNDTLAKQKSQVASFWLFSACVHM